MENINSVKKIYNTPEPDISYILHRKGREQGIAVSGNFEITKRCNFNCKMCYIHSAADNLCAKAELPAEWWIKTGREAADAGMVFLLITGGEPLIREDFPQIYKALTEMGLVISVNTNGYLLDGKTAELFREYPPYRLNISLYGSNDDTYERLCGVRAFTKVVSNIKLMKSIGIEVKLNCSLTQDNCREAEEIYRIAEKLGVRVKSTPYMYPKFRAKGETGKNDNRLTAEDAAFYRVQTSLYKYTAEDFIRRAEGMKKGINMFSDICAEASEGDKMSCRAGTSSFWINWEGRMTACGIFDYKPSDTVKLGFREAWENVKKAAAEIRLPKECAVCRYKHFCHVCAAVCYTETGGFTEVPCYVCRLTEKTAELTEAAKEKLLKEQK